MTDAGPSARERDIKLLRDTSAAAEAGDLARAFSLAESALADGLSHPLFYKLRSLSREKKGQLVEAVADLRSALVDAPSDFAALNALGLCLARLGRSREGLAELDAAIALQPDYLPAHLNQAWTFETLGDLAAARRVYERVLELDADNRRALAGLAWMAARRGDWPAARGQAERALAQGGDEPAARLALIKAELEEGQAATAERDLEALIAENRLGPHELSIALSLRGDVLDGLDRTAEAFEAYRGANKVIGDFYASRQTVGGAGTALALVDRMGAYFSNAEPEDWRRRDAAAAQGGGQGFIVGFPRSGTTLLGQVLAAHPKVITLDEHELLADPGRAFLEQPGGLDRLAALDQDELDRLRRTYRARAEAQTGPLDGRMMVDKLPMNSLALPLICRMFPDARIIFVQRDPRDVVLSCFRQQFTPNRTNLEFLTLEGAARFYDSMMRLVVQFEAKLDMDLRWQRHEDLVQDFEGETRAICGFLGLEWTADLGQFAQQASTRDIATPSAGQVARGLYSEGMGQWRRYRSSLAPVLDLLRPWVDRFGYAVD